MNARPFETEDYAIAQQARCIRVHIAIDLALKHDEGEMIRTTLTHTEVRDPEAEDYAESEIRQIAGDLAVAAWLKACGELTPMRRAELGIVEETRQ